jgi:thiosulfate/3-mercaptopyruvate sulfurtransferase
MNLHAKRIGQIAILIGSIVAANWVAADAPPASSIPAADLIQPADLAAALQSEAKQKPLILQVGFRTLYDQSHIPGSEYAGPGRDGEGLNLLKERVAKMSKDSGIVLYCGCCPWTRCPNVAQAYDTLHQLGFKNLKVLYIPNNFGADWVDKGYPATKGP